VRTAIADSGESRHEGESDGAKCRRRQHRQHRTHHSRTAPIAAARHRRIKKCKNLQNAVGGRALPSHAGSEGWLREGSAEQ